MNEAFSGVYPNPQEALEKALGEKGPRTRPHLFHQPRRFDWGASYAAEERQSPSGKLGGNGRGTTLITGGTGKLTGIQGSAEYLEFNMRPAADGIFQGYTRAQGQHNALIRRLHISPLP